MNVKKCENGHFYDADSFGSCPHCKDMISCPDADGDKKKRFGLKRKERKNNAENDTVSDPVKTDKDNKEKFVCEPTVVLSGCIPEDFNNLFSETEIQQKKTTENFFDFPVPKEENEDDYGFSESLSYGGNVLFEDPDVFPSADETAIPALIGTADKTIAGDVRIVSDGIDEDEVPVPSDDVLMVPAVSEVPGCVVSFPGKVCDGDCPHADTDHGCIAHETDTAVLQQDGFDPVVGWLVGITGPDRGRSFELYTGRNSVGRSRIFSVPLSGNISSDADFFVIYDGRSNRFTITSGGARDIVYVDGSAVLMNSELNSGSFIDIGSRKYLFVSICGHETDWNVLSGR